MIGLNSLTIPITFPESMMFCRVVYTVTDRIGGKYGAGETCVDVLAIKTKSGIDITHSVPCTQLVIIKQVVCEIEAENTLKQSILKSKKEGISC